jgi:hypothetical protein
MHVSAKIIKILLIYIVNIHTQVSINTYRLGSMTRVNMDAPQEVWEI